ncbi:MAG TPA: matrixin family metalloprotease [Aggregicoccus sp.]|nr:matrixin family metalloprotease [Aggregicoccus sp.]
MTLALLLAVASAIDSRLLLRLLTFCCVAAAALYGPPARAYELKRDASGAVVRWQGAVRFVVEAQLAERLAAPGADVAVEAAVHTLRQYLGALEVELAPGAADAVGYDVSEGAHNQSQIVALEDWPYDPATLAVTVVTLDTRDHRILDADIAFNAAHRQFAVLPEDASEGGLYDDVQNTLTHELGHALGLGHNGALPDAVMFPSARRGETRKRALHEDDRAGLAELYGRAVAMELAQEQGCSATGGSSSALALALLALPLLWRRRRGAARLLPGLGLGLSLLLAGSAQAADVVRQQAAVDEAGVVATAEVVAVRTLPPEPGARLLQSEVELRVRECLKGSCPERLVLRVPGGRLGHIEQHVEGLEVPAAGESVGVTVRSGAQPERPSPRAAGLYRLQVMADFAAFARGLSAAGWTGELPLPGAGSARTRSSAATPAGLR